MRKLGTLSRKSSPMLLATAALVDFVVAVTLVALFRPVIDPPLALIIPQMEWRTFGLVVLFVYFGWIVSEVMLGGRSIGRSVLGLQPRDKSGGALSGTALFRRGTGKVSTFGLTGLNPFRPARYDLKSGVVWHSPLAPAKTGPIEEWRIIIRGGSLNSRSSRLGAIPGFRKRREVRFGRDGSWADVRFSETDRKVSGQHCILYMNGGRLFLKDGNGAGKPSSRGTALNGKPMRPGQSRAIGSARSFCIADITVEILR